MGITLADILIAFRGDRTHVDRTQADLTRDLRRFADQTVRVVVDLDGARLQQGLARTQEQVRTAGAGINGVLAGAFSYVIGGAITAGLNAVAGGIKGIADGMVGGNAAFEDYNVRFTTLLKSTDLAKQRMGELATFAANTPFDLPQVVQADLILQGFGFHSAEAATKFGYSGEQIRTIAGDLAAGTGRSFEEITSLFGRFSTGLVGEALMRFGEIGAVNRDQLRAMGVEFNKAGELISDKSQAMNALLTLLQGKYGGLMEAQSMTLNGMLSNLRDWFGNAARIVGQPLFEGLRTSAFMLLQVLNSPEAKVGLEAMARGMANLVGHVGAVISALLPIGAMIAGIFVPLVKMGAEWGSGFVGAFADGISMAAGLVGDALGGLASMITGLLMPNSPPKILPDLDTWGTKAAEVWMGGWQEADFSLFDSIGTSINQALANAVGSGQMGEANQIPMLAQTKAALAELITNFRATGEVSATALRSLTQAAGPAGRSVSDIAMAYLKVESATRAVERSQQALNDSTAKYDALLSPLNAEMAQLNAREQEINDQRRVADIGQQLDKASGPERELLLIEVKRIALRKQITTQEQAKAAEVAAGEATLKAAQEQEKQTKNDLAALQAKQKMETDSVAMAQQQVTLLEKLAKAVGTAGGAMGGMAKSQNEVNAAVQEARVKAAALRGQYDALMAKMTAMRDQGAAWVKPMTDGFTRIRASAQTFLNQNAFVVIKDTMLSVARTIRDTFVPVVGIGGDVLRRLGQDALAAGRWLLTDLLPPMMRVYSALATMLAPHIIWLATFVRDRVVPALEMAGRWLGAHLPGAVLAIIPLLGYVSTAFSWMESAIVRAVDTFSSFRVGMVNGVGGGISNALYSLESVSPVFETLGNAVVRLFDLFDSLRAGVARLTEHFAGFFATLKGSNLLMIVGGIAAAMVGLPVLTGGFTMLAGGAGLVTTALGPLGALFGGLTPLLGGMGAAFLVLMNPVKMFRGGIFLVSEAVRLFTINWRVFKYILGTTGGPMIILKGILASFWQFLLAPIPTLMRLGPLLLNLGRTILGLFSPLGIAITLVTLFAGAWATNFEGIREVVFTTIGPVMPLLSGLATMFEWVVKALLAGKWDVAFSLLQQGFRELGPLLGGVAQSFQEGIPAIFGILMDFLTMIATKAIAWVGEQLPILITTLGTWAMAFVDWIVPMIPPMLVSLGTMLGSILDGIGKAIPGIVESLATLAATFIAWIGPMIPPLLIQLGVFIQNIWDWIIERAPGILAKLGEWGLQLVGWIVPMISPFLLAAGKLFAGFLAWIVEKAPELFTQLGVWATQFTEWASKEAGPALTTALGTMFTALWTELQRLWGLAFAEGSLGKSIIDGIKKGITDGWTEFSTWISEKMTISIPIPSWMGGSSAAPAPTQDSGGSWGGGGGGGSWDSGVSGVSAPVYAAGTNYHPGGLALVGEEGPELVNLPRGSAVTPAGKTAALLSSPLMTAVNRPLASLDAAMASAPSAMAAGAARTIRAGGGSAGGVPSVTVNVYHPVVDTEARLQQMGATIVKSATDAAIAAIEKVFSHGVDAQIRAAS